MSDYRLQVWPVPILTHAVEAWDRGEQARQMPDRDRMPTPTASAPRPRLEVKIEKEAGNRVCPVLATPGEVR